MNPKEISETFYECKSKVSRVKKDLPKRSSKQDLDGLKATLTAVYETLINIRNEDNRYYEEHKGELSFEELVLLNKRIYFAREWGKHHEQFYKMQEDLQTATQKNDYDSVLRIGLRLTYLRKIQSPE